MALSELVPAKSSLDRMNKGSMTLDEILMQQRSEKQKTGLGFNSESSSSMKSGNSIFVKGPALQSGILVTPNAKHGNTRTNKNVPKPRPIPICHFCWIKGHIRLHCNKMRNQRQNPQRKRTSSPQKI